MAEKKSLGPNPWVYPQPVFLVGTYDSEGKPNIMTAAWGGICSSDPVSLCVSIRPARWTHQAILDSKCFTVSIPDEKLMAQADYAGLASGRRYDKFTASGLTPVKAEKVNAPYVGECPVILECELLQTVDLNVHTMMIGRIVDVKADVQYLNAEGTAPDATKFHPVVYSAADSAYYAMGAKIGKGFSEGKRFFTKD